MAFNKAAFEVNFAASMLALAGSEKITKAELMVQSRAILEATHVTGDIAYVNRLLAILTPVNRKVCVKFFEHFAGFSYDDGLASFTKKSKKRYEEAEKLSAEFLEDPLNNVWTWADRNIEVTSKEFDLAQVTQAFNNFVKKAQKVNLTQKDVIKAVLASGVELETILELMQDVYNVDAEETKIVINA